MGFAAVALSKIKSIYQRPALKRITLEEAKARLGILDWFPPPAPGQASIRHKGLKHYSPPRLQELDPEQARLILIGHATVGDKGARELLELIYPEPEARTGTDGH